MDTVSTIFEKLGGVTAIANATGIPLTTVHGWKRSGFVPKWRVPALIELAKRIDVQVTAEDFPPRREPAVSVDAGSHKAGTATATVASSSGTNATFSGAEEAA
ncbi:MAG: helix-turn-helix domain-containing protein [Sphingomonadales bacterium]|nr:helix-turn-helix domain-containing protein [Sphingomonadales bacterium]